MPAYIGKGDSNQGGCAKGTKGTKAPSVKAVGDRADKFHTSRGK
jgi:hypothetical protein